MIHLFLSWSGQRSYLVAKAFYVSLKEIFRDSDLEIYFSENMTKGVRWNQALNDALNNADFGILCLTKENLSAPWLMYEAGALSRKAVVAPFLLDLDAPKPEEPVTQFQLTTFEREDLKSLILSIRDCFVDKKEAVVDQDILERLFQLEYDRKEGGLEQRLREAREARESDKKDRIERLRELCKDNQTLLRDVLFEIQTRCT